MKKLFKRLFTFAMVMTMLISGSTVAMAAETSENSTLVSNDAPAVVLVSDDGIIDVVPIGEDGTIEYTVSDYMARSYSESNPIYSHTYYNQSVDDIVTVTRAMPYTGYVVVKLDVQGSAKITVKLKSGIWSSKLYDDSATNGTSWKISNATANQGVTVEMKVTPLVNNTTYTLKFWVE